MVRRYLLTGVVDESERTFFEGIVSLPAAHNAVVEVGAPAALARPERYWRLPEQGYDGGRVRAAGEFAERFFESVRLHARSDVPVGTCLSGGLDSSAIVCTADRLRRKGAIPSYAHHGFGYVPEDPAHSERPYMEEVVAVTGLEMTYVQVPAERFDRALVEIVRQQDEPFGSTSIAAQYLVFEAAAAEGMKVMLDGQGADEIMGGYEHYFPEIAAALLRGRRFAAYARFARGQRRGRGAAPIGARHALYALAPARVRDAAASRLPLPPAAPLLAAEQRAGSSPADGRVGDFGSVEELFAAHTTSLGLPALLRFEDRNSMAHSIEARVPFLDHRLVEFCFRLPFDYKVHGANTKEVMREGAAGRAAGSDPRAHRQGRLPGRARRHLELRRAQPRGAAGLRGTAGGPLPGSRRPPRFARRRRPLGRRRVRALAGDQHEAVAAPPLGSGRRRPRGGRLACPR